MQEWSKKKRGRGRELSMLALKVFCVAILALFAVVTSRAAWQMYQKFAAASEGRHAAQAELAELLKKKEGIEAAVAQLQSPRGVEGEIRERFGVAKAGEGEIRIVRDEEEGASAADEPGNLWEWIVETFFVW